MTTILPSRLQFVELRLNDRKSLQQHNNITDTAPINNNVMMGTEKTPAGTENSPYLTCGKLVLALGMGTE